MGLGEIAAGDYLIPGFIKVNIWVCVKKVESATSSPRELDF
jgi:hypothetical protein